MALSLVQEAFNKAFQKSYKKTFYTLSGQVNVKPIRPVTTDFTSLGVAKGLIGNKASSVSRPTAVDVFNEMLKGQDLSKLTPEQQAARSQALLEKAGKTKKKPNKFLDVLGDVGNVLLDTITLPGRTTAGIMYRGAQAMNQGEPWYSTLDDMLYGAQRNLSGKEHTTFADYMYETPIGDTIAKMPGGWQKKALEFGVPLVGGIVTDPTTYISGGSLTKVKGSSLEGKAGISSVAEQIARREATAGTNYPTQILHNQKPIVDSIVKATRQNINNMITEVYGGARAGKIIGKGKETTRSIARDIAERIKNSRIETLDEAVAKFKPQKLAKSKVAVRGQYPILKEWEDAVAAAVKAKIKNPQEAARNIILSKYSDDAIETANRIAKEFDEAIITKPTLKFMGHKVATLPGNLHSLSGKLEDTIITKLTKGFSYDKQFPGGTGKIAQISRARAAQIFNDIQKDAGNLVKGLSKEERIAINSHIPLSGALRPKQQELEGLYKRLFDLEQALGMRKGEIYDPSYRYTRIKSRGGHSENARTITGKRRAVQNEIQKAYVQLSKTKLAAKKTEIRAHIASLKSQITPEELKKKIVEKQAFIEEDAVKNLMAKASRSANKQQRELFRQGLVKTYGTVGYFENLSSTPLTEAQTAATLMANRGLQDVSELGKRAGVFTPGKVKFGGKNTFQKMYLDKNIADVFQNFEKAGANLADENIRPILDIFDKFMGNWKRMQTIYSPFAFNVKNAMSDAIFGMMDDIGPKEYLRLAKAAGRDLPKILAGEATTQILTLRGGLKMKIDDLWKLYSENLGQGGLIHSDVPVNVSRFSLPRRLKIISEGREDFGRFVHFIGAFEDAMANGATLQDAISSSMYRVNKFKFDYGALTKGESAIKRVAPFYTFPRKAIPTVAQSAITHPRTLATLHKIYENRPEDTPGLKGWMWPDFLTQPGVRAFGSGPNPWGLTSTGTPLETIQQPANLLSMMGPLPSAGLELATGRSTFNDRPIDTTTKAGIAKVFASKFTPRLYREIKSMIDSGNTPLATTLLSGLTGQKLYQVSDKMIASQQKALEAQYEDELNKINKEMGLEDLGYSIFMRSGDKSGTIGIRDLKTGKITEYDDPKKAMEVVKKLLSGS